MGGHEQMTIFRNDDDDRRFLGPKDKREKPEKITKTSTEITCLGFIILFV